MRRPSLREPRSIWDILSVLIAYVVLEYIVLRTTGSLLVQRELVVVGILVVLWTMWAFLRIVSLHA